MITVTKIFSLNKTFYDQILNKKKDEEKEMTKEEFDEMVTRLSHNIDGKPAEANKELLGKQRYEMIGIYGTYAMNAWR